MRISRSMTHDWRASGAMRDGAAGRWFDPALHPLTVFTSGLNEPAIALTDYVLALETGLFALLIARPRDGRQRARRRWFALFFGAAALASFAGGTTHGFFPNAATKGHAALWRVTLIAIGLGALAAWGIGARLRFTPPIARRVALVAGAEFAAYCAVVLFLTQRFRIAIVNYLPATLFLLAVFAGRYAALRERPLLPGIAGIALTFAAAGIQQGEVALHPRYFDHNALYHLVQALAFALFFASARWLVDQPAPPTREEPAARPQHTRMGRWFTPCARRSDGTAGHGSE